jgi:Beta-galactosidase
MLVTMLLCLFAGARLAAPAQGKRRTVAFGAMGMALSPDVAIAGGASNAQIDAQVASMARNGVESVRREFSWEGANPARGVYDWSQTDLLMHAIASHGLDFLPVVMYTPHWASSQPGRHFYARYAPKNPNVLGTFMRAAVKRYGTRGTYWKQHPRTPYQPVVNWEIWNEPSQPYPWLTRPWQRSYIKVLKSGYRAIHKADRRAKVVLASLSGSAAGGAWDDLHDVYAAGAKRYFDIVALNFYTNGDADPDGARISAKTSVNREFLGIQFMRDVMRRNHDTRKPLWLTEFTWLAAKGKVPSSNYSGANAFEPVPTTEKGQAARLKEFFRRFPAARKRYGLVRAYWETWATRYNYDARGVGFDYSGMNSWIAGKPFTPKPLLGTFRGIARRLEGCRKTSNAHRCV